MGTTIAASAHPASSNAAPSAPQEGGGGRKYGVVLFDDEKDPRGAWTAVNGSPARRVEGMNELATDTLWLSNMSYEAFNRTTEAWRNPWLRGEGYLVVKIKDILAEWGLDPATTPPNYTATFCSTVFSRIMTLAYRLARECDDRVRASTFFVNGNLREDLRRLLPRAEYPRGEPAQALRSGHAYAEFTVTATRGIKGARQIMLRRPRISHALEMLATPVPKGEFEFRSRSELRQLSPDRVAWIREATRPCMVELSVERMDADVAPIYGFGNATDKNQKVARSWVAHPEFLAMASFSDIEVKSAYVGQQYHQLNLELPEPMRRFLSERNAETSWCAGIIAETIWRAACLAEGKGRGQAQAAGEERPGTSWRGAWIRAADKTSMFMVAMQLTELGYNVSSYGMGWVAVRATEDQIQDLLADALSVGLIPKLTDIPQGMFDAKARIPWGGDKQSQILAHLLMTRQKNLLWNLDKLPLYERSQQGEMLKKMLEAHKNQKL